MPLSPAAQNALLALARSAIDRHLRGAGPPPPLTDPEVQRAAGCFVSLHAGHDLRGCIGTFSESDPLWVAVARMAVSAATEDHRFERVADHELPGLTVEISVLSPRRAVRDPGEIEVGRHGVWLSQGQRRGVLLPQVAVHEGWDRETFLDHTCLKAGLRAGAWRDPATTLEVFEAEVFGER